MNRDEKSAAIDEIAAQIEGAEAIFAVDYRGISVSQAAELRGKLSESDASFRVVKNRLTKLAADKAGEDRLTDLLDGPTALTFVRGDTAGAAKAISTFNKEHDVLTFKGGFMDGTTLDEDTFKSIARLPSREVLDGQLAGIVASPLTGLVRGLGSMISGLALQLGQIAEQGLVSGEAPAEGQAIEETAADGGAESPAEEESQSDSSTTSEGDEPDASDEDTSSEEAADAEQGSDDPPASEAEPSTPAESDDGDAQPEADDDPSVTSSGEAEGPSADAESPDEASETDETSNDEKEE